MTNWCDCFLRVNSGSSCSFSESFELLISTTSLSLIISSWSCSYPQCSESSLSTLIKLSIDLPSSCHCMLNFAHLKITLCHFIKCLSNLLFTTAFLRIIIRKSERTENVICLWLHWVYQSVNLNFLQLFLNTR